MTGTPPDAQLRLGPRGFGPEELVVTIDVAAALDACVAPVPGDGLTAEPAVWVDPGDGSLRSVRSRRGG